MKFRTSYVIVYLYTDTLMGLLISLITSPKYLMSSGFSWASLVHLSLENTNTNALATLKLILLLDPLLTLVMWMQSFRIFMLQSDSVLCQCGQETGGTSCHLLLSSNEESLYTNTHFLIETNVNHKCFRCLETLSFI